MNEKIKKFFINIGVFFSGVVTSILCICGISLYNNRKRTETTGRKQSDNAESIETIADRLEQNESIFATIRKRKKDD